MPKICDITGKKVQFGHNVSKANNKTKRKFSVNLQSVTFNFVEIDARERLKSAPEFVDYLFRIRKILG